MRNLVLALLALPLAGCVVPQWERAVENNCSAQAARQTGFYGGQSYFSYPSRIYATNYYNCLDQSRFVANTYGYGGYAYANGYGYPYAYGYPNAYPGNPGYYGPPVGAGAGFRGR